MNICAVRTSVSADGFSRQLPHEPESEQRIVTEAYVWAPEGLWLATGHYIVRAVCKHCGSIFAVEESK